MIRANRQRLAKLRGIYIDCGWRDQFHIHFGSRQLSLELQKYGINHHYEEFSGTHSGIDYRLDNSLPFLAKALKA
jgi:enterochelin esterase-like enzyme